MHSHKIECNGKVELKNMYKLKKYIKQRLREGTLGATQILGYNILERANYSSPFGKRKKKLIIDLCINKNNEHRIFLSP